MVLPRVCYSYYLGIHVNIGSKRFLATIMYHFNRKKLTRTLISVLCFGLLAVTNCMHAISADEIVLSSPIDAEAVKDSGTKLPGEIAVNVSSTYPLPPPKNQLKVAPSSVEIYQYDETPIGNRSPLLLVHGLRGEFREEFRWDMVIEKLMQKPEFREKFKVYFARYNTYVLLGTMKESFKKAVRDLYQNTGKKQITMMALSMGGNLVQEAMTDIDVNSSVEKVITLGTPFHGSPLFCFDWLRYSIIRNHSVPWVRADLCLSYKMYFSLHPNLLEDLRWDNSDHGIPDLGHFSSWIPYHVTGDIDLKRMANQRIAKLNELQIDKKKFICYGGYLLTPYATPHKPGHLAKAVKWPWWFATCTVPYHLGFEHPVLRALNFEMGRMVVAGPKNKKEALRGSSRYALNDGITPLVSALFLPSEALAHDPITREPSISKIRRNIDISRARVFRQIDHITFVDNYRPHRLPKELRDELNPNMAAREIFDWMFVDLMETPSKLAESNAEQAIQSD